METFEKVYDFVAEAYRKNGTSWLTKIGYTGIVASPILAAFGAVRAYKELENRKKERGIEELPFKETAGIIAKNAALPVVVTVGTIAVNAKVQSDLIAAKDALTTALVLEEKTKTALKEAEKEVVGEEKSEEIQKKADEKVIENAETRMIECDPVRGVYPCIDTKTGQIFPSSKARIESAFNMVSREVINDNVFLGQFIEACGGIWYLHNEEVCIAGSEYCWPESKTNVYEIKIDLMEDKYGNPMYVIRYPENGGLTAVADLPWKI